MISNIESDEAPQAVGPYSQAIKVQGPVSGMVYVSGQIPIDPRTGGLIEGSIGEMTSKVLDNIAAILRAAGCDLSHVIKVEIFLCDISQFQEMNAVYTEYFDGSVKPARQAVEVSALPLGAPIEISCVAVC